MINLPYLRVDCLRKRGRTPCIVAYIKSLYVADTREVSNYTCGPHVMDIVHTPHRNTQLRRNLGRQRPGWTLVLEGVHSHLYSFTLQFCRTQSEHLCRCVHFYSFFFLLHENSVGIKGTRSEFASLVYSVSCKCFKIFL
jgi:hypothetical protein